MTTDNELTERQVQDRRLEQVQTPDGYRKALDELYDCSGCGYAYVANARLTLAIDRLSAILSQQDESKWNFDDPDEP